MSPQSSPTPDPDPTPYRARPVVDLLGDGGEWIASFASALEAYRYACLVHEPGTLLYVRRSADGASKRFDPHETATKLTLWANSSKSDLRTPTAAPAEPSTGRGICYATPAVVWRDLGDSQP